MHLTWRLLPRPLSSRVAADVPRVSEVILSHTLFKVYLVVALLNLFMLGKLEMHCQSPVFK